MKAVTLVVWKTVATVVEVVGREKVSYCWACYWMTQPAPEGSLIEHGAGGQMRQPKAARVKWMKARQPKLTKEQVC